MDDEHKIVLVTGGPGDGFDFYGPFDDESEAIEFAEKSNFENAWWLVNLKAPVIE